jgi:hypothetical protein
MRTKEIPSIKGAEMTAETSQATGTKVSCPGFDGDKDYNIVWFVEACLSNALRMETYAQDAEREGDTELVEFFRRMTRNRDTRRVRGDGSRPPRRNRAGGGGSVRLGPHGAHGSNAAASR